MKTGSRSNRRKGVVSLLTDPPAPAVRESVRWSRVRTARARIASGFYDREDVREKLAEAVLAELED